MIYWVLTFLFILVFFKINEAIRRSESSIVIDYCLGLSRHEEILFRTIVTDLRKCEVDDITFDRLFEKYKPLCLDKGLAPLSATGAFQLIMAISR